MPNIVTPGLRVRHLGSVLLAALVGCGSRDGAGVRADESGPAVGAPDGSYELRVPARWTGAYRVDSLSTPEQGTARPGALNLVYLPADSAIRPQTLVVVAAYDSAASNLFAPGSADAARFDSLGLSPAEATALVRIR